MCLNGVVYLSQQPPQKEDPMSTEKFAGRAEDITWLYDLTASKYEIVQTEEETD